MSESAQTSVMKPPSNTFVHVKGGNDNIIQRLLNCNIIKEQLTRNHKINDHKIRIATDKNTKAVSGLNHHGLHSTNAFD
jgi:hypothetical protein